MNSIPDNLLSNMMVDCAPDKVDMVQEVLWRYRASGMATMDEEGGKGSDELVVSFIVRKQARAGYRRPMSEAST